MAKTASKTPRWRDLPQKDKAAEASILLSETNQGAHSFTLKLGSKRIDNARAKQKGFVTHIRDTMRYHLEQRLWRVPHFWIVVENIGRDGNGVELHVHGVIAIEPVEEEAMKRALLEVAGNTDRARALKLKVLYDAKGWASYCFKNLHKGDPECTGFAMERGLRQAARRDHDERRQAGLRAAEAHCHAGRPAPAIPVSADAASLSHPPSPDRPMSNAPAHDHAGAEDAQANADHSLGDDYDALDATLDFLDFARDDTETDSEVVGIPGCLDERIRVANISLTNLLLHSYESAARGSADAIGAQIDALGNDDDPGVAAHRQDLERDRREALARAGRMLDERIALACGRRSPEECNLGVVVAPGGGVLDVEAGARLKSPENFLGSL